MGEHRLDLKDLLPVGITLVITGIAIAFGLQVTGDVKVDIAEDSCPRQHSDYAYNSSSGNCYNTSNTSQTEVGVSTAEYNATGDTITGVSKLSSKLPIIATVIVAVIIIGLLVKYFTNK